MLKLKSVLKFVMACWFGFVVLTTFLALYPFLAVTMRNSKWHYLAHRLRKAGASWCVFWGGIVVECIFEEQLEKSTYVITPNHTSKLDMIILTAKLGIDFTFAANKKFGNIPLFGVFIRTMDLPVDLKNIRGAAVTYKKALSQLEEGKNLVIFPEGTIARITPKLSKFKQGAFRMAIEKQVDVLPVTMIGGWNLLPDDGPFHFSPGKIILYVHAPVSTKGMHIDQSQMLSQQVFSKIEKKLAFYGY